MLRGLSEYGSSLPSQHGGGGDRVIFSQSQAAEGQQAPGWRAGTALHAHYTVDDWHGYYGFVRRLVTAWMLL